MVEMGGFPVVCETRVRVAVNQGLGRRVIEREILLIYFFSIRSTSRYRDGGGPITATASDTVYVISRTIEFCATL